MTSSDLRLENGLVLRSVRDETDIHRYVEFNTTYNNPNEGRNTGILLRYYPGTQSENFWLIEQPETGQIVATTCLIPWEMEFEGIQLRAAQLEQVLSHPDFRRQGLIKILVRRFMQAVQERGLDLSFIWGIPYYYRQYGYTYAIEGNCYESLPSARIPDTSQAGNNPYSFRQATLSDCQVLTDLYRQCMHPYALTLTRTPQHWRYLLEYSHFPVELIERASSGQAVGYLGACTHPDIPGFSVVESGLTDAQVTLPALQHLKTRTSGDVQIFWPQGSALARMARNLGSNPVVVGQWLFNIPNLAQFLVKLAPVFEQRLAGSGFADLTQELIINLFRQAYQLSFTAGKLTNVQSLGFVDSSMGADGGDLCIPPDAFVRLLLAYRSLDELLDAWPDIIVKPQARSLLEALFPKKPSYLYATYAYFGGT
jgi:N-acetylglutamate synthase-like GNAT family acetyltransferase